MLVIRKREVGGGGVGFFLLLLLLFGFVCSFGILTLVYSVFSPEGSG